MKFDVSGEPAHTRCLAIALTQGQKQEEGDSIEFRADILDLRKGGLMGLAGRVATAGIIHKMEVSGAFESTTHRIQRIEWQQSHVMHEANRATRGECCRDPMARLESLVGTRLGEGFAGHLKQCFGGPLGCTHVNTLLQELSAVVSRLEVKRGQFGELRAARAPGERIAARSLFFDAFCHDDGDIATVSVRLADVHFAPLDATGSEGLVSHDELRLLADVELAGWQLRAVQVKERCRQGPVFGEAPWHPRTERLGDLTGRSLGGGMARFCLERFGELDEDARLCSALLSLAPGMTQVGVALSDSLVPASSARPGDSPLTGPGPCYMLRADGPLIETLFSRPVSDATPSGE